ncbi:hypothetical protein [uncultured Roseobacter sp.]|uniref:hypothetical protein n=1 Tax=uncultured Roseobacter sp. TaxID=114847 RepID=UPI00260E1BE3|nr:hypothetical protein [uncultured Roseobacter sp.]
MKKYLLLIAFGLMSACATQIMQGYVGRDITEVVLDYGKPTNVVELPDGRTAFQWNRTTSYTAPITTNIYGSGSYATATTYGGGTSYSDCLYTLFAQPNAQGSFTVTGYKEPSFSCL